LAQTVGISMHNFVSTFVCTVPPQWGHWRKVGAQTEFVPPISIHFQRHWWLVI